MKIAFRTANDGKECKIFLNDWRVGVVKLNIWTQKWTMHPSFYLPYSLANTEYIKFDSAYEAGRKMVDLYNVVFPSIDETVINNFGLSLEEVVSFLKTRE